MGPVVRSSLVLIGKKEEEGTPKRRKGERKSPGEGNGGLQIYKGKVHR